MTRLRFGSEVVKASLGGCMNAVIAGMGLPAPDCGIDVSRVDFDAVAPPASALGGHQGRAAAEKTIERNVTARRAVQNGIGDESDWFRGRMESEQIAFFSSSPEIIGCGICPHIGAIAAMSPEVDVVAMWTPARFKHRYMFVLATVEGAHPGIVLDPDANVFELEIAGFCRGE